MAKIKVRKATIPDLPQLVEKQVLFYQTLQQKGAKDIAVNPDTLRGGVIMELGYGFQNPNWLYIVATKDDTVIGFMISILEMCAPIQGDFKCVRIHGLYLENDTLGGPAVLNAMWGMTESWAEEQGAGHFYANIHPGNQPSVRAAKSMQFKHHYTQFYRPIKIEKAELIEGEE